MHIVYLTHGGLSSAHYLSTGASVGLLFGAAYGFIKLVTDFIKLLHRSAPK
jgi:hypothetical protein